MAASIESFKLALNQGYQFKGQGIKLGNAVFNGVTYTDVPVSAPLSTFNRHGLVAGATGTGKTKTLQKMAESLSLNGVSVLMMDIKGDLSGLGAAGIDNPKIQERINLLGETWSGKAFPIELLSISKEPGARLRATVSEFGPVLLSRILGLNETQSDVLSMLFKICDDKHLALLDLKDLKKALQYYANEGKAEIKSEYGQVSSATLSTILRSIVSLEEQGADEFFGELSFDVTDLCKVNDNGLGAINLIRLGDIQTKPALFSTFMLCLLAEIYQTFPERGDQEQPELVIFIDEAHLIFKEASKTLLEQLETIIKLIRSKGVGIFFCTQNPVDVPDGILSQLGLKVQHALRAFTEKDRKAIKAAAENYPITEFYDTDELLTQLGIGEALITVLNEKGIPTPLAHTVLSPPQSRMDILQAAEIQSIVSSSSLCSKYAEVIDRESAYEILTGKIQQSISPEEENSNENTSKQDAAGIGSGILEIMNSPVGKVVTRELTRGLLGVLGIGGGSKGRRKSNGLGSILGF